VVARPNSRLKNALSIMRGGKHLPLPKIVVGRIRDLRRGRFRARPRRADDETSVFIDGRPAGCRWNGVARRIALPIHGKHHTCLAPGRVKSVTVTTKSCPSRSSARNPTPADAGIAAPGVDLEHQNRKKCCELATSEQRQDRRDRLVAYHLRVGSNSRKSLGGVSARQSQGRYP
jgi:hypothetical protein